MNPRSFLRPLLVAGLLLSVAARIAAADWPGWRGPDRDGYTAAPLPASLPVTPKVAWRHPIGHGYAGVVVAGGRLVYLDDTAGRETAHCLDAATGRELWATPYAEAWSDEFEPGPRCTPQIDRDLLFVQSVRGEFACLALADGGKRWRFHFEDYGTVWINERNSGMGSASRRGNTGSPVVEGDRVLVQVGSTNGASLAAFDRTSGRLLWKSQNDLTCYASPITGTLGGVRQLVAATCEGLLGVAVDDGRPLWRVPFRTGANRNVLTPILDGDSVIFASFTTGLRRVKVAAGSTAATQTPQPEWLNAELRINLSTPVLVHQHLYGLGALKSGEYVCVDAATGSIAWREKGFNDVAATLTDGTRLLVLLDSGEVRLLTVDPAKYVEIGRFQASGKTYSHPAWDGARLYVRDSRELIAYALP